MKRTVLIQRALVERIVERTLLIQRTLVKRIEHHSGEDSIDTEGSNGEENVSVERVVLIQRVVVGWICFDIVSRKGEDT